MDATDWYYSLNSQRQGPVSAEEIRSLQDRRVIDGSTLVWRVGMTNWQPLATLPDFLLPAGQARCAQCGQILLQSEMIQYDNVWICAACKPSFVQKLKEGVGVGSLPGMAIRRWKDQLVVLKDATLPPRCVKCNAPAEGEGLVRKLYWHPPLVYVFLLCNVIIYAIVAVIVRKRATITVGLCGKHREARRKAIMTAWGIFAGSVGLCVASAVFSNAWLILAGIIALITSIIWGVIGGRVVYPLKIDKERVWLGGVCSEYRNTFPEWDGRS